MIGGFALEILVALLALHLVRQGRVYHRPAAVYLALFAAADVLRGVRTLTPLYHPAPYVGLARAAFRLDEALFLAPILGLGWVTLAVYWPRLDGLRHRYLAVALFVAVTVPTAYPALRGAALGHAYAAITVAVELFTWGAAIAWLRRNRAGWPSPTHRLILCYAAAEIVVLLGPYTAPNVFTAWPVSWGTYTLLQLVALVLQGLQASVSVGADPGASPGAARGATRR